MQNLIKTITNRYFKTMLDKRFHIYLTEERINVCWIRSVSNSRKNYFKTFKYNPKEIKELINWVVVKTGFPQAKINIVIEAPLENHNDLVCLLSDNDIEVTII
jgi:hypothetical protein